LHSAYHCFAAAKICSSSSLSSVFVFQLCAVVSGFQKKSVFITGMASLQPDSEIETYVDEDLSNEEAPKKD